MVSIYAFSNNVCKNLFLCTLPQIVYYQLLFIIIVLSQDFTCYSHHNLWPRFDLLINEYQFVTYEPLTNWFFHMHLATRIFRRWLYRWFWIQVGKRKSFFLKPPNDGIPAMPPLRRYTGKSTGLRAWGFCSVPSSSCDNSGLSLSLSFLICHVIGLQDLQGPLIVLDSIKVCKGKLAKTPHFINS